VCSSDLLAFVPLHPTKERERGFNQSELIARQLSLLSGIELSSGLILRQKYTKSQTKLGRKERSENISGAFFTNDSLIGKSVLIVDDVITTGATLNECAKILKQAGCRKVDVIALATPTDILQLSNESEQ